ncbi:adhesin [Escherichia coli]|nr:adhesin [Escherichia coli]
MKRHLNTCYRLVWNHITGAFVVASELARARGKRGGVAVALSLAAVTSLPVLAADIVVHPGETVNGGTLANHDNQIVFGTTNGMTISTGLEYGPDNEANTGGQWVQDGGTANKTTVTSGGLQRVNPGGSVSDTVTRSQLINSIDILRARRATGLMTRDNYRTVNNITLGKYPEAK